VSVRVGSGGRGVTSNKVAPCAPVAASNTLLFLGCELGTASPRHNSVLIRLPLFRGGVSLQITVRGFYPSG